jgi:soluble lytic murein transglycosylase-like protein
VKAFLRQAGEVLVVGMLLALSLFVIVYPTIALGAAPARPAPAALVNPFTSADIPHAANQHRQNLTRQARLVWGLDAPVAVLGAQIHQESAWNRYAKSPVGAQGLAQFMPKTAAWMPEIDGQLADVDAYNPTWAFRAIARYDYWLLARVKAETPCDRWAMALAAYNGGLGWVYKDQKRAAANGYNAGRWWGHVEHFNAGRSKANFHENRGYPQRILLTLLPRYVAAGWGEPVCL